MLPNRGQFVASSLKKTLQAASRSYAAAVPLTDALEESSDVRQPRKYAGDVKITKLENGINVASYDNGGSVSRLSIALNTGSRHETNSLQGITHLLKNASFITNNERTSLRTVREIQQAGGSLECAASRELLSRNAIFLRTKLGEVFENVAPGLTSPLFSSWDLSEVKAHCHAENSALASNGTAVNLEMLHKVAYRNGLGNSLYCDELRVGSFSPSHMDEFAKSNYVGERLTIVGSDVDHDELLRYVKELLGNLPRGQAVQSAPQKYHSGEVHKHTSNGLTYASLVAEGAGLFHADLPTVTVLQRILGSGQYMKWGSNTLSSRLNKAASAVTQGPLLINSLNLSYSDSGLFGFHAIAEAQTITPVLKSAVGQVGAIAKGEVTAEELQRAKTQARGGVLMLSESNEQRVDDITKQIALNGTYTDPMQALDSIDQVSLDSVTQVAKRIFKGEPSLAVTGDTSSAPYADELF